MNLRITFILIQLLFFFNGLNAQPEKRNEPIIPKQVAKSVLFGFDKFINDQPLQNQQNLVICSAFNGWLYAAYSYFNNTVNQEAITFLQSKDNGVTWNVLQNENVGLWHLKITKMDIAIGGQDTANLKLFVGYCNYDSISTSHTALVTRYNGNTGAVEEEILHENSKYIRDLALASDGIYPEGNSNPFTLGVVYSKDVFTGNAIVFCSSSNGGMSFNGQTTIALSSHYFDKVALTYGRSFSYPSGRYFAAWEEQVDANSPYGHIYTAHSEPNFNSSFTAPVMIDNFDPSAYNYSKNPVIACQCNNIDNDSSNLTEVVLFEKFVPATNTSKLCGVFNPKATDSTSFHKFNLNTSANNQLQPGICFNPFDSSFIVTYFDSTLQKLPYLLNDFNMTNPDSWSVFSTGYNDNGNLVVPHPRVVVNFATHSGVNAWIDSRPGGNGAAMFDAPLIYYTGVPEKGETINILSLKIFPNPASEYSVVEFELSKIADVEFVISSSLGRSRVKKSFHSCTAGKHNIKLDLSEYPSGIYVITIYAGNSISSGKIIVTK